MSGGDMFEKGDLQDALKAIPIVLVQQLIGKAWKNKKFSNKLFKHTLDAYIAVAVGNMGGRLFSRGSGQIRGVAGKDPKLYNW